MIAVDTNVLVRVLTGDEPKQEFAGRTVFASDAVWIAKTLLLETAWVLQRGYGFDDAAIRASFAKLLGLSRIHVEDESSVIEALALSEHGIDLADAMHLSSRPRGGEFVTFDKAFVRHARSAGVSNISAVNL